MKQAGLLLPCLVLPLFTALPVASQEWIFQGGVAVWSKTSRPPWRSARTASRPSSSTPTTRPAPSRARPTTPCGPAAGPAGAAVFLQNRPPEIEQFSISHGYNYILVNRGWEIGRLVARAGAGAIVAHPESRVRGRSLDDSRGGLGGGYHLTGPALQIGLEGRFTLGAGTFLGLEGKLTAARAQVPVAGGEADVPNVAAHALLSLGWRSGREE